jgi:predicted glycosyltransferase
MIGRKRILIAPLDWGLGHATRCIPIIKELLHRQHEVVIAAEGPIKALLENEFPGINCLPLRGYRIQYARTKNRLLLSIITQLPKLLLNINRERKWLEKIIKQKEIDIVISDNRFGLYNKKIYSIFITHQLLIKSPFFEQGLQKLNYSFINRFDECWVPDIEKAPNLAGDLSHPAKLPATNVRYIGCLSRFQNVEKTSEQKKLLILLSGPEPQRTLMEKKLILELNKLSRPVLFVRGLPGSLHPLAATSHITFINHLPASELQEAILQAEFVIARSGYSTIMDLIKLKKKSILIPTPGQTEQEYLAEYLMKENLAFSVNQKNFNLKNTLLDAQSFPYSFLELNNDLFKTVLTFT